MSSFLVPSILVAAASLLSGAPPTSPPPPPEDAAALVERTLDALGGRRSIAELRSLSVAADCTGPGGGFRTWVDSLRPDAVHFRQQSDEGSIELWSTAEATWRRGADGEAERIDHGSRSFLRAHEFHLLLLELETRFSDHRLGALDRVADRPCRRLEMTDGEGQPASFCIDTAEGLPIELVMNPGGGAGPLEIRFADWREIEGIRYFHSFVLTEGPERAFTYRYDSIQPNAVSALDFVAPAAPDNPPQPPPG